ncbi:MAG: CBS domain-containing protein [Planctomycetes bacterium]|jgi:CBS domain-containing protein|nr:CBS domain-containing protein [Planctomycetota bacterium]
MKAQDLMTRDVWSCTEDTSIQEAAKMMFEREVGALPIVDSEHRLKGMLTDRDICCRAVGQGKGFSTPVSEIMSKALHFVNDQTDIEEVESVMKEYKIRRLPVVDENRKLKGIISIGDLATHLHGLWKEHHVAETLEAVSTGPESSKF